MKNKIIIIILILISILCGLYMYKYTKLSNEKNFIRVGNESIVSDLTNEDFEEPDLWLEKDKEKILEVINESTESNVSDVELLSYEVRDDYIIMGIMGDDFSTFTLTYDKKLKYYTISID